MSTSVSGTICGVLLAAGSGSRFAGPTHKLLADLDGDPVVVRSLRSLLAAGFEHNIVVTGAADLTGVLPQDPRLTVVSNPRHLEGMATSLDVAVGVAGELGCDVAVVGLADQPFVATEDWRRVGGTDAPIAVATYRGRQRNPVRLHAAVWPLLPLGGDEGARPVLRVRPELVHPVACEGLPDDIDTVEDLARWS